MQKNMGIYKILNLENNKCYIGSSRNLKKRFNEHLWGLRKGIHGNTRLQNAYNKYGESEFEFSVIEYVEDRETLYDREQFWLDHFRSYERDKGYNIIPTARYQPEYGEATREKLSKSKKGKPSPLRGTTKSPETCKKISESKKGQKYNGMGYWKGKHLLPEAREKLAKRFRREWLVIDIEGNESKVDNLKQWCKEHDINYNSVTVKKDFQGWKFRRLN